MIELKPCPFCGGGAYRTAGEIRRKRYVGVMCYDCGAGSPLIGVDKPRIKDEENPAIKAWNRRVKE